jgi:hypothetical protein
LVVSLLLREVRSIGARERLAWHRGHVLARRENGEEAWGWAGVRMPILCFCSHWHLFFFPYHTHFTLYASDTSRLPFPCQRRPIVLVVAHITQHRSQDGTAASRCVRRPKNQAASHPFPPSLLPPSPPFLPGETKFWREGRRTANTDGQQTRHYCQFLLLLVDFPFPPLPPCLSRQMTGVTFFWIIDYSLLICFLGLGGIQCVRRARKVPLRHLSVSERVGFLSPPLNPPLAGRVRLLIGSPFC